MNLLHLLIIAQILITLPRGVMLLIKPSQLTAIFWNESLLSPILIFFGSNFQEYITHPFLGSFLYSLNIFLALVLIVSGLLFLAYFVCELKGKSFLVGPAGEKLNLKGSDGRILKFHIFTSVLVLFLIAFLKSASRGYNFVVLFEWAIQVATPAVFYLWVKAKRDKSQRTAEIITAVTFLTHGIFASGLYYEVPAHFLDMTINFWGVGESFARYYLLGAAVLDFLAFAALISRRCVSAALYWCVFWGAATASARALTYMDSMQDVVTNIYWFLQTTVRLPHALIPLFLLALCKPSLFGANGHTQK